jgi:hypothetical protein
MPIRLANLYIKAAEEGLSVDSREFNRRLQAALPLGRLHRRPVPLNHLRPKRSGSPRLTNHDRIVRAITRSQVEPKFDRTIADGVKALRARR